MSLTPFLVVRAPFVRSAGPWPASLNNAYVNLPSTRRGGGGRAMTQAAHSWKDYVTTLTKLAVRELPREMLGRLLDPDYELELLLHYRFPPPRNRRDISNLIKLTEDAVMGALGVDDRRIAEIHARRDYGDKGQPGCLTAGLYHDPGFLNGMFARLGC